MARLRFDNISSRGTSNPITFADGTTTTGTFSSAPGFPTIASPDYAAITVDPDTSAEEIVYLTAFTAGATTGTFTRAQEGTSGAAHSSKPWVHAPTALDFIPALDYVEAWLGGTSDIPFSANTVTNIVSAAVAAGTWEIFGQVSFANPGTSGGPGDYAVYVTEGSASAPSNAVAAAEYQALPASQGFTLCFKKTVVIASATTLYLNIYGDHQGNVWHFGNFIGGIITGFTATRIK